MKLLHRSDDWVPAQLDTTKAALTMLVERKKIRTRKYNGAPKGENDNLSSTLEGISALRNGRSGSVTIPVWLNVWAPKLQLIEKYAETALAMDQVNRVLKYGCADPVFILQEFKDEYCRYTDARKPWDSQNKTRWLPQSEEIRPQRCGKCYACCQTHAASFATISEIEWLSSLQGALLITRTFATDEQTDYELSLSWEERYHAMMRMRCKRAGEIWRTYSCHEFGSERFRRHFHDMLFMNWETAHKLMGYPKEFEDYKNPLARYWVCDKDGPWPWGVMHVELINDHKGAGYVGKYQSKQKQLMYDPTMIVTRDMMQKRGEPIMARYTKTPRPGLGTNGIQQLVKGQAERIAEQQKWTPQQITEALVKGEEVGLCLPQDYNDAVKPRARPAILRPQDRKKAAQAFTMETGILTETIGELNQHETDLRKAISQGAYRATITKWDDETCLSDTPAITALEKSKRLATGQ